MILYLRNDKNENIVDLEFFVKSSCGEKYFDIRCVVLLDKYSEFLLNNLDKKTEIISDFNSLSELRGWLWEYYFSNKKNIYSDEDYKTILGLLREILISLSKKYNFIYVED